MSDPNRASWRYYLLLHLSLLAISTSGPLGRAVAMSPLQVIFWRAALAALLFALIGWGRKWSFRIARQDRLRLLLTGLLMGVHWLTYFQSLQLSSVAIGMLSLFTFPVFTAFLEPLILRTRFQLMHLWLGGLTLLGVYFLLPSFDLTNSSVQAIAWGLLSALCYALRNILSKGQVARYSSMTVMFYQMATTALLLVPLNYWQGWGPIRTEWPEVLMLAVCTTIIGHSLFLHSLRQLSVTTVSIISSVQPVYGIILGALFLHELPGWLTYLGGGLILLAVVLESVRQQHQRRPG
jgi:drug/metabolite transporter (DMT)-like permease